MAPEGPLFISYSRKDYYFAESLAHHLIKRDVAAVWLDVRDLNPGVFWERDLEEAVDRASCVVLVVSPESMQTANVEQEWRRALRQGKRIVVACFRKVRAPEELSTCEVVDFRGAFGPALNHLISRLQSSPGAAAQARRRILPCVPPGILALRFTLAAPSAGYFVLANWRLDPQGSSLLNAVVLVLLPVGVLLLVWFFCFSFLRRGMGMTRLTTILAALSGLYAYPLVLSRLESSAGLAGYASVPGSSEWESLPSSSCGSSGGRSLKACCGSMSCSAQRSSSRWPWCSCG